MPKLYNCRESPEYFSNGIFFFTQNKIFVVKNIYVYT